MNAVGTYDNINPGLLKRRNLSVTAVLTTPAGIFTSAALVSSPLFGLNTLLSYVIVFLNCGKPAAHDYKKYE